MQAMIRLFCAVGVGDELGLRYAVSFRAQGRAVRVFALIGGNVFTPAWRGHEDMFLVPVTDPYINVVCSGPNFSLGRPIRASELVPDPQIAAQMGLNRHPTTKLPDKTSDEIVYEPGTALGAMHTASALANVAITSCRPVYPTAAEIANLSRYDAVLCPDGDCTYRLIREGLKNVQTVPPARDDLLEAVMRSLERQPVAA